jgi:hypothetical protein
LSNKDDFDTTYRKVKGFHIIGYDADTDTFSKLHIDQNGHIFAKLVASRDDDTAQALSVNENDGALKVSVDTTAIEILTDICDQLKMVNVHLQSITDEKLSEGDLR